MTSPPRILALAGSLRRGSYNKRLVRIAVAGAQAAGAELTLVDLRDHPLPVFDEDLETAEGPPAAALELNRQFIQHTGLLIAAPEYNSSITGALKNAIDWVSRPGPSEAPMALVGFRGKAAALMSASPGALGGLRGLVHLRAILGNIGVIVLPDQVAVPRAGEAFDETGRLKDARQQAAVEGLGRGLAEFLRKLHG